MAPRSGTKFEASPGRGTVSAQIAVRAVLIPLWALAAAAGLWLLLAYSLTPGRAAQAQELWPAGLGFQRDETKPQLVMVAHPECPCTRSSIAELSWLMTRLQGQVAATVLFLAPEAAPGAFTETDLWRSATIIDGVRVLSDRGGEQSHKFGAYTSGQVYLYDAAGRLRFSGGITATRGHQGDNVGRRRIVDLVTGGAAQRDTSAVYGCDLEGPEPALEWWARLIAFTRGS